MPQTPTQAYVAPPASATTQVSRARWSRFVPCVRALLMLLLTAALVDRTAPIRSLAEHAASFAGSSATLPERLDDATMTALMRDYTGDARFATLAGGCFWGLELAYQRTPGVLCTCVGYTQGHATCPSYAEVCSEATGHTEAVLLLYDHSLVSYAALAELLFERIGDPTMLNRVGSARTRSNHGPCGSLCRGWHRGLTDARLPSPVCAAAIKAHSTGPGCTSTRRRRRPRRKLPLSARPAAGRAPAAMWSPRSGPQASSGRQRRSTSSSLRRATAARGRHSQLRRERTRPSGVTGETRESARSRVSASCFISRYFGTRTRTPPKACVNPVRQTSRPHSPRQR